MLFLVTIFELSAGLYATVLTTQAARKATHETATGVANNRGLRDAGANPIAPGGVFTGRKSEAGRTCVALPTASKTFKHSKGGCEKYH
jgi:hypothetical protein